MEPGNKAKLFEQEKALPALLFIPECVEVEGEGVGAIRPALEGVWHPEVGVHTGDVSRFTDSLRARGSVGVDGE